MKKQFALTLAVLLLWALLAPACAFAQTDNMDPANQPCSETIATAVVDYWRAHLKEDQLPHAENVQRSLCKVNPADPAQMIVAVGPDDQGDEDAWTELAIVNTATHRVIAAGDAQLDPGGPAGIAPTSIDTARYNLANGVRAFGLLAEDDYSPNCGDGFPGPTLYLYVREGKRIRPVLKGLYLSETRLIVRIGDRCSAATDPGTPDITGTEVLSIAIAPSSSHGYHDLRITADCSREPALNNGHAERAPAPSRLLHYNGKEYPIENDLSCGDRWSIAAVVVKTTQGLSIIKNGPGKTFLPSSPVQIVAREPTRVLVQNYSGGSWWLPRDAIAEPAAFKRVRVWQGPATFEDDTADGDSGTTYHFHADGSYTFDFENSNGSSKHGTGHLWEYGSIVAAGSDDSARGSYFWRQLDGALCDASLDGCPQP